MLQCPSVSIPAAACLLAYSQVVGIYISITNTANKRG